MLRRLEKVIDEADWSLCLVGEDPSRKLAELNDELRRPFSDCGDSKQIPSGYAYWGIEPTIAWARAYADPLYLGAKDSLASFPERWHRLRRGLAGRGYHYMSLGPGTGEKDRVILSDLQPCHPETLYIPVDLSAEMLLVCLRPIRHLPFIRSLRRQLLPVQLDFSSESNVVKLDRLRRRLIDDQPVLFSLLGNTLANFDHDLELVERLGRLLLRSGDRLLIEVATASPVDAGTAQAVAREYKGSRGYREWVASALHQHTDLRIDVDSLLFQGLVEDERAVMVKVIYQNQSGSDLRITLADRSEVPFPQRDTIRVSLTRKYDSKAFEASLGDLGFTIENKVQTCMPKRKGLHWVGLELALLSWTGACRGLPPP